MSLQDLVVVVVLLGFVRASAIYPGDFSLDVATLGSDNPCPIAFNLIGGRCYFYGSFKLNWFRSMEFCHSFGQEVSLAAIETNDENEHLKQWLVKHGDHSTGVWVGGSDNGHAGKWAWFPTGQLIRSFNWGPSQPSGGDQHCMYIVGGFLGYQWADFHCDFKMTFLCEYQVNPQKAWKRKRKRRLRIPEKELFEADFGHEWSNLTKDEYIIQLQKRIQEFSEPDPLTNEISSRYHLMDDFVNGAKHTSLELLASKEVGYSYPDSRATIFSHQNSIVISKPTPALIMTKPFQLLQTSWKPDEKTQWSIFHMIKNSIAKGSRMQNN